MNDHAHRQSEPVKARDGRFERREMGRWGTGRWGMGRWAAAALALVCFLALTPGKAQAQDKKVVIFAAASLRNVLDDINAAYAHDTGQPPATIDYAASSTLARQIENGAPADIFISADLDWMNYLDKRHLIQPATRRNLLGNSLVLIAPKKNAPTGIVIKQGFDLKQLLGGGKLAMADTRAVPAGRYGKAALQSLGVWSSVSGDVAQAENVRAALLLVARGEAPLGIVYRTDAAIEPDVAIVGTFPANALPPIIYPAALVKGAKPAATPFLAYLFSAKARPLFEHGGFAVLY